MIITTTQSIDWQSIREYKEIVVGEVFMGTNIVCDFFALITDVIGCRSGVLDQYSIELLVVSFSENDQLNDYARDELRNHLRAFEG